MKNKTKILTICAIAIVLIVGVMAIALNIGKSEIKRLWPASELKNYDLYVHNNQAGTGNNSVRLVSDTNLKKEMISLCEDMTPFRPVTAADDDRRAEQEFRSGYFRYLFFTDGEKEYYVNVLDEDQLELDYIYKDKPLVEVRVTEKDESGRRQCLERWYCILPPDNYAQLCNITHTFYSEDVADSPYIFGEDGVY